MHTHGNFNTLISEDKRGVSCGKFWGGLRMCDMSVIVIWGSASSRAVVVHPSFELGIYLRFRDDHGVASELHIRKTKTHHWEGRLYRELGDVDGDVVSRAIETLIQSCTNILITRPNNIIPD
jgi:hypothetical protein